MLRWLSSAMIRSKKNGETQVAGVVPAWIRFSIVGYVVTYTRRLRSNRVSSRCRPPRLRREMLLEGEQRLLLQRQSIDQEQHALRPARTHQRVHQGDRGARLPRPGRHHQQELAAPRLDRLEQSADGLDLIVAAGDRRVDQLDRQRTLRLPPLRQPFEVVARRKAHDAGRGVRARVPEEMLVAVGVHHERGLAAVDALQLLGVLLRLLLAELGVATRLLGLDDRHRLAAQQQPVVGEPMPSVRLAPFAHGPCVRLLDVDVQFLDHLGRDRARPSPPDPAARR